MLTKYLIATNYSEYFLADKFELEAYLDNQFATPEALVKLISPIKVKLEYRTRPNNIEHLKKKYFWSKPGSLIPYLEEEKYLLYGEKFITWLYFMRKNIHWIACIEAETQDELEKKILLAI